VEVVGRLSKMKQFLALLALVAVVAADSKYNFGKFPDLLFAMKRLNLHLDIVYR
jgi:hypothetical protein